MGDNAAQLFYGVKLKDGYEKGCPNYREIFKVGEQGEQEESEIMLEEPYETEENYMIISKTSKLTFNGGELIGDNILTEAGWKKKLIDKADELGIKIDYSAIGWYIVGHYN